jgi:hypothetical protein
MQHLNSCFPRLRHRVRFSWRARLGKVAFAQPTSRFRSRERPHLTSRISRSSTTTSPLPSPTALYHLSRCSRGKLRPFRSIPYRPCVLDGSIELTSPPTAASLELSHRLPGHPRPRQLSALSDQLWLLVSRLLLPASPALMLPPTARFTRSLVPSLMVRENSSPRRHEASEATTNLRGDRRKHVNRY